MKQCMCVRVYCPKNKEFLEEYVMAQAKKNQIEGIGQLVNPDQVQIFVCAKQDGIENFLDALYAANGSMTLDKIEIEPCSLERDFRGVFRIVE